MILMLICRQLTDTNLSKAHMPDIMQSGGFPSGLLGKLFGPLMKNVSVFR